jgi:hypothetical protein
MSIKSKVLAAAATLTLLSGAGTAGVLTAGPAHAATGICGTFCTDVFNAQFGKSDLVDVFRQGANIGQPIILFQASNIDRAEDFTVDIQASVNVLAGIGLVSPLVALHYGPNIAKEYEYTPDGTPTDLCVGVAATAFSGEGVTLQPCGVSGRTIWIDDNLVSPITGLNDAAVINGILYFPLINGSTTTFTHPQVLTYPAFANPTSIPRPQITVHSLQKFSNGLVFHNQMWSSVPGPV